MAYSDDTYYTWIARGKDGYRAAPVTTITVTRSEIPHTQATVNVPAQGFDSIHTWSNITEWYNDTSTAITIPISGGDVSKLILRKTNMLAMWVEVYDQNNNRVASKEYGIGPAEGNYNNWCPTRPLYLYLAAIPGTAPSGGIHFSFAGEVNVIKYVEYGGMAGNRYIDLYANTGGDREIQLMDELLDGSYLDAEGIAPTGGTGGGGGYFYRPDEVVGVPSLPTVSVCDTGFVSLYKTNATELQSLASYMWDEGFFNNIVKNFNSPMENIISLQMVPFNPSGDAANIVIGNLDTGVQSTKLSTSFYHVSCGQKNIAEFYKSFADYAPYTPAISLFLPYIGMVSLPPDDCMAGSIKIDYNIDVFSGACIAFVSCNTNGVWHVLQQHQGTITNTFPLSGANYMGVYTGLLNAAASLTGGLMTGNIMSGAVNAGAELMNTKPEYLRSGNVSSAAGLMGTQYPYLIFTTPQYIMADNFRDIKGYTSNLKCKIGSCSGFFQATADNSELSGISCTAEELDMIRSLLADGIYI